MDTYLNTPIIEVITRFPEVGTILVEYEVGCVTCPVGTCLLKDVVSIHDLPPETETVLMARIAAAVSQAPSAEPGVAPDASGAAPSAGEAAVPASAPVAAAASPVRRRQFTYSPPMHALIDEHVLIKRWVALIPGLLQVIDLDRAADRQLVLDGVDFIRSYADRFHHAKEEDILFKYFDEDSAVIQAMLADHEAARAHVRELAAAVDHRDYAGVSEHLTAYGELLSGHIEREDEILYPWMDRELTTGQVGEMFSRFAGVDEAAGQGFTERYGALIDQIEELIETRGSQGPAIIISGSEARR